MSTRKFIYHEGDADIGNMLNGDILLYDSGTVQFKSSIGFIKIATTKADIEGLENVDNVSDANKPVSSAVQAALDIINTAISNRALSIHNHDGVYSLVAHNHNGTYALLSHNHDGSYSLTTHNHDGSYAPLVGGKIPEQYIGNTTLSNFLGDAADEAELLTYSGNEGDWALKLDTNQLAFLITSTGSLLTDWKFITLGGAGGVITINGKTGSSVTLDSDDIGALAKLTPLVNKKGSPYTLDSNENGKNISVNTDVTIPVLTSGMQFAIYNDSGVEINLLTSSTTKVGLGVGAVLPYTYAYVYYITNSSVVIEGSPVLIEHNQNLTSTSEYTAAGQGVAFQTNLSTVHSFTIRSVGALKVSTTVTEQIGLQVFANGVWKTAEYTGTVTEVVVNSSFTSTISNVTVVQSNDDIRFSDVIGNDPEVPLEFEATFNIFAGVMSVSVVSKTIQGGNNVFKRAEYFVNNIGSVTAIRLKPGTYTTLGQMSLSVNGVNNIDVGDTEILELSGSSTEFLTQLTNVDNFTIESIGEITTDATTILELEFKVGGSWISTGYKLLQNGIGAGTSFGSGNTITPSTYSSTGCFLTESGSEINARVDVALGDLFVTSDAVTTLLSDFDGAYKRLFGYSRLTTASKATNVRVKCSGATMSGKLKLKVK